MLNHNPGEDRPRMEKPLEFFFDFFFRDAIVCSQRMLGNTWKEYQVAFAHSGR